MSDLSDWLEVQSLTNLSRFAGRPVEQLHQVIVTEAMKDAAMEYVYSLYDQNITTFLLDDIYRIMSVLRPVDLEPHKEPPSLGHGYRQIAEAPFPSQK